MPTKPKEANVPASPLVAGMKATKLEYQAVEDDQEKALRLHKEPNWCQGRGRGIEERLGDIPPSPYRLGNLVKPHAGDRAARR